MSRPVIALLTDFGTAGPYVGAMKGAILSVCPDAVLVDITHDIPPHDIAAGGAVLAAALPYFPAGTVVVAVVDPGVGTTRGALAASCGPYVLLGPDNGLLAPAIEAAGGASAIVSVENPRYFRPAVSATFEGRDRFAPAAAWLASGVALAELGPPLRGFTPAAVPAPAASGDELSGSVVWADRFGNLVTNLTCERWHLESRGRTGEVWAGALRLGPPVRTYADLDPGTCGALFGSSGALEIAVREGSAAARLGAGAGVAVRVVWR